jgi:hypothetical protein
MPADEFLSASTSSNVPYFRFDSSVELPSRLWVGINLGSIEDSSEFRNLIKGYGS